MPKIILYCVWFFSYVHIDLHSIIMYESWKLHKTFCPHLCLNCTFCFLVARTRSFTPKNVEFKPHSFVAIIIEEVPCLLLEQHPSRDLYRFHPEDVPNVVETGFSHGPQDKVPAEALSGFPLGALWEEKLCFLCQTFMIFFFFLFLLPFILKREPARSVWILAASKYN